MKGVDRNGKSHVLMRRLGRPRPEQAERKRLSEGEQVDHTPVHVASSRRLSGQNRA
jgi:hypothetical protein